MWRSSMHLSLPPETFAEIAGRVAAANTRFQQRYPGEPTGRRPVHTVYAGAQLFKSGSAARLGGLALTSLDEYAPDFATFARAIGLPDAPELPDNPQGVAAMEAAFAADAATAREINPAGGLAWTIYTRVREKLQREPVEDMRIDFEDGYGSRPDTEEDGHA